jgi:hypothetical protein
MLAVNKSGDTEGCPYIHGNHRRTPVRRSKLVEQPLLSRLIFVSICDGHQESFGSRCRRRGLR